VDQSDRQLDRAASWNEISDLSRKLPVFSTVSSGAQRKPNSLECKTKNRNLRSNFLFRIFSRLNWCTASGIACKLEPVSRYHGTSCESFGTRDRALTQGWLRGLSQQRTTEFVESTNDLNSPWYGAAALSRS
jgi:hypothetical protein